MSIARRSATFSFSMRKREVWETDAGVNGIVGRETRVALSFREKTVELLNSRQFFWGALSEAQRLFKNPRISDVRFSGLPS